jgi:hypothetical protein
MYGARSASRAAILERNEYDPTRHAVVMLSTFREMLHKWIIDLYLQTPHRGIKDTPAHRWRSALSDLPPPLPPTARDLDVVLGMTAQRVVFHYGIELESLKYNGPELGELRRRIGSGAKIELIPQSANVATLNFSDIFGNFYRHLFRVLPRPEFGFLHDAFEQFVIEDWKGFIRGQHRYFSAAVRRNSHWVTAKEAERIGRTTDERILELAREGQVDAIFLKVRRGGSRTECWIRREN